MLYLIIKAFNIQTDQMPKQKIIHALPLISWLRFKSFLTTALLYRFMTFCDTIIMLLQNKIAFYLHICVTFPVTVSAFVDEVANLTLRNPYTPFPGGELQQSDAPIPAIIYTHEVLGGATAAVGRRRRSTTITIDTLCTTVFSSSTFAT